MANKIYDIVRSTYGAKGFNLTDNEFAADMKDANKRAKLYGNLSRDVDGFEMTREEFDAALGFGKVKEETKKAGGGEPGVKTKEGAAGSLAAEPQGTVAKDPMPEASGTVASLPAGEAAGTVADEGARGYSQGTVAEKDVAKTLPADVANNGEAMDYGNGFRQVRKAKGGDKPKVGAVVAELANGEKVAIGKSEKKEVNESENWTEEEKRERAEFADERERRYAREAEKGWIAAAEADGSQMRTMDENWERLKSLVGDYNKGLREAKAKEDANETRIFLDKYNGSRERDEIIKLYSKFYDFNGKSKIEGRKDATESLVNFVARQRMKRIEDLLMGGIDNENLSAMDGEELELLIKTKDEWKERELKRVEAESNAELKVLGSLHKESHVDPVTGQKVERWVNDDGNYFSESEIARLRREGEAKIDERMNRLFGKLDDKLAKEVYHRERNYANFMLEEQKKARAAIVEANGGEKSMNLRHAEMFDKDARDLMAQKNRWDADKNNAGQSFADYLVSSLTSFTDADNIPVIGSIMQLNRLTAVYEISKKLNDNGEGKLTPDEQALLNSYNTLSMVMGNIAENRSKATKIGEMAGVSGAFMVSMAMFNWVIKGLGKAATLGAEKCVERLAKYAAKNGGKALRKGALKVTEKAMRGVAKGIGKMYGSYDVNVGGKRIVMNEFKNPLADFAAKEAGATLQTIVTPQMYIDLMEKRAAVMAAKGRELTDSEVMESMYNSWGEISSEASFARLNNWIVNKAYKGVAPIMPKFLRNFVDTRKFLRTGLNTFHGMPQEFLEEEWNAARSALVGRLFGWEDTVRQSEQFFTREGQLDMIGSFALPTAVGGAMQMGIAVRNKHQYEKSREALLFGMRGMGMSDKDIDGMVSFMEQSKDLETFEKRANTIYAAIMTKKMEEGMSFEKASEETNGLMGGYINNFMTYNENLNTTMAQWEKMSDEEKEAAKVTYGGIASDIAHKRYNAGVVSEIEGKYGLQEGGLSDIFERRKEGGELSEVEEKAINEYAHRMVIAQQVKEKLQPEFEEIDKRSTIEGKLITATYNGEKVNVKSSGDNTSVIVLPDGSEKQVATSTLSNIEEQDTEELKAKMEEEMNDKLPKMDEFRPGRIVRMKNGKVGVVLQQTDAGIVVGRQEGKEMVNDVYSWGELKDKEALGVLPGNVYGDLVVDSVETNPETGERTVWFRTVNGKESGGMNESEFVEMLDKSGVDMAAVRFEGELTDEEKAKERAEVEKEIRNEVAGLEKRFGVKVNVVADLRDITNKNVVRALNEKKEVEGWYGTETGSVYLYIPNISDARRAKEVVFHEIVGHKGLRELVGEENYHNICLRVWKGMSVENQKEYLEYAISNMPAGKAAGTVADREARGYSRGTGAFNPAAEQPGTVATVAEELKVIAADEYMARVAEGVAKGEEYEKNESLLEKIWNVIKSFLDELFAGDSMLTRGEVVRMIRISRLRLENQAMIERQQTEEMDAAARAEMAVMAERQAAIEENEAIVARGEADFWVEAEKARLDDVARRRAEIEMDEQLEREAEAEAARQEADRRENSQTGKRAEEANRKMDEEFMTPEEKAIAELKEAEGAGAENYGVNKRKSLGDAVKKMRKKVAEAKDAIKVMGDINAIRRKKKDIEAKEAKIKEMEDEIVVWEKLERDSRPSGKLVEEEAAEVKAIIDKHGAGKSQEWKDTVKEAVEAGSEDAIYALTKEDGFVNAVEVASNLVGEVGRSEGLLVNDRGDVGKKVRGKGGRGFKTMIGTKYADVKGAFALFRDTEEALSIDQLAHRLSERLVDAGLSEDGNEAVSVLQDLFNSERKEWDLTHKREKRLIQEAKDILWYEENKRKEENEWNDGVVRFSVRREAAPKKTGIGYKVFFRGKDGKLYPPMVANPNGEDTPVGVWLNADEGARVADSKTGRPQVKQGGKGTQGGSGSLAYRPGWHLGEIPYALQFNRKDENGNKTLFPKDFVWAEVEYAMDNDYQEEAMKEGVNANGKFVHSLAGLKRIPTDGYYKYRTNPNPETDPWIITGAMKVNKVLTKEEVDELVKAAGREPQRVEGGEVRFSVSPKMDAEYMEAVEKGDMEKAQRMVMKAAIDNGYTLHAYHTSVNGGITKFEDGHRGPRPEHSIDELANGGWFDNFKDNKYGNNLYEVYIKMGNPFGLHGDAVAVREAKMSVEKAIESKDRKAIKDAKDNLAEVLNKKEPFYMAMNMGKEAMSDYPEAKTYGEALRMKLQNDGYDGVVMMNTDADMSGGSDWYLPFNSEIQVKSADAVTYDDEGKVVPLSERFDEGKEDIRFSVKRRKMDAEYMEAVEKGDMEKAQRMVDEVAKKAGYLDMGYHGTTKYIETETPDERYYGFNPYEKTDNTFYVFNSNSHFATGNPRAAERRAEKKARVSKYFDLEPKVMNVFLKAENLKDVEDPAGKGGFDSYLEVNQNEYWRKQCAIAKNEGYDGLIYDNVIEGGISVVMFSPNNIKSADAVTYDDEGKVVPLSERFNEGKEDIRFSVRRGGEDVADAETDKSVEVIDAASEAVKKVEDLKKREPIYRDREHVGESTVQFMERWKEWRDEMDGAIRDDEEARKAYEKRYGESVPEMPRYQTGMTLGEYLQLFAQYANNIDGMKLVADWNKEFRWYRKGWQYVERQMYEKNVSLKDWMEKLKAVAKENGIEFEIDENTNILEAIRQVSSRVEPRVRSFVENEMKAVAKAIAAISADAEAEMNSVKWVETKHFGKFQRQRGGWKIGDWEYGIRWKNVDGDKTPEAERRNGKELTPLELIGAYLQALDAVEVEQHEEWEIPDRGMWGFLNQLYTIEDGKEAPMTAERLIELFEEHIGEEKCRALQDAMFDATLFTMNELLRGGLIDKAAYDDVLKVDEDGNTGRRHYVPERGWAREEYMDDTVFADAMKTSNGRTSLSASPVIYTFLLAQSAVNTAERNLMRQKLYNMAMTYKTLGQATGAYHAAKMYLWRSSDGTKAQWTETPPTKEVIEHDEKLREEIKGKQRERKKLMAEWRKIEYALRMKDVKEIDIEKKDEEFTKSQEIARAVDVIDAEIKALQERMWINPIERDMNKPKVGYDTETGRLVKMRVDGVEYSVVLNDVEAARAINGFYWNDLSDNFHRYWSAATSMAGIDKLTKLLSALKTQYSFTFATSNFFRDVQFSGIMNAIEKGEKFAVKALVNVMSKYNVGAIRAYLNGTLEEYAKKGAKQAAAAAMMKEFAEGGGITGYSFMQDSKKMRAMFGKILKTEEKKARGMSEFWAEWTAAPLSKSSEYLEAASQISELMTRFGQYVTEIENGASKFDAISSAKHITTNFNIQGNLAGYLGPFFMFTNATLQGGYRIILGGCKSKKARRKLMLWCTLYTIGGYLQACLWPDDPDEERFVPDWMRKTSFMAGRVAIPLPHFFRTFWYMGTCLADAVRGKKQWNIALTDGLVNMLEDNLPTPANLLSCWEISEEANTQDAFEPKLNVGLFKHNVSPSIIQPIVDIIYNVNFMGSPIYKVAYDKNDQPISNKTLQYFKNTDPWLIEACKWLERETGGDNDNELSTRGVDINPGKVQYIIKNYTSGALVDIWKGAQDIVGCCKALYYMDGNYVPRPQDWILVNRFYKPYERDRMQTQYFWDVYNSNNAFVKFFKGQSAEKKEEWMKRPEYKLYIESRGKMAVMNEKIKAGMTLTDEEIKELMEWSARWNKM